MSTETKPKREKIKLQRHEIACVKAAIKAGALNITGQKICLINLRRKQAGRVRELKAAEKRLVALRAPATTPRLRASA